MHAVIFYLPEIQATLYSSGCRQRRPLKRLKSLSVVIHSHPDSIAIAARYASGTRFPFAPISTHRRRNSSQWRVPGSTRTRFAKLAGKRERVGERARLVEDLRVSYDADEPA